MPDPELGQSLPGDRPNISELGPATARPEQLLWIGDSVGPRRGAGRLMLRGFYVALYIASIVTRPEGMGRVCVILVSGLLSAAWALDEYENSVRAAANYRIIVEETSPKLSSVAIRYVNEVDIRSRHLLPVDPWLTEPWIWFAVSALIAALV